MNAVQDLKQTFSKKLLEKIDLQEEYMDSTRLVEALDGYEEKVIPPAEELIKYINEGSATSYAKDTGLLKMLLDYHQATLHLKLEGQDG